MVELYSQIESDIIANMARRLKKFNYFIPESGWQFAKLQEMGVVYDEIITKLSSASGKTKKEIETLIIDAGAASLKYDDKIYKAAGLMPTTLKASPNVISVLNAGMTTTKGLFQNLTRTTANTASNQFENALDRAYFKSQPVHSIRNSAII